MPKRVLFGEFFKTWRLWSNSVTRQVSFNRTKICEKLPKFKCDILSNFQTMCSACALDSIFKVFWKINWENCNIFSTVLLLVISFQSEILLFPAKIWIALRDIRGGTNDNDALASSGYHFLVQHFSFELYLMKVSAKVTLFNPIGKSTIMLKDILVFGLNASCNVVMD